MVLANVAAGRYYLIVDGFSTEQGTFTLDVSGSIANGASCELPLARSGALRCGVGYACKGAVGSRTCEVAACATARFLDFGPRSHVSAIIDNVILQNPNFDFPHQNWWVKKSSKHF